MLEFMTLSCPYCGESFETGVDASAGDSDYIEDCAVCCRPIEVHVRAHGDSVDVSTRRGDE